MAALRSMLLVFLLSLVCFSSGEMSSGSGSGSDDVCDNVNCWGGGTCVEEDGMAKCLCPNGTAIYDEKYKCEECALGYWGGNCEMTCASSCGGDGHFKSCDAVNGDCTCNDCWGGDSCEYEAVGKDGYACVLQYLESVDKDLTEFGGDIPVADDSKLPALAEDLVDDTGTVVQDESVYMTVIDREDVGASPLLRLSFTLNGGPGSTDYDNAIGSLKDKVKTGEIRGTLIIDESDGDSGKVTLNA